MHWARARETGTVNYTHSTGLANMAILTNFVSYIHAPSLTLRITNRSQCHVCDGKNYFENSAKIKRNTDTMPRIRAYTYDTKTKTKIGCISYHFISIYYFSQITDNHTHSMNTRNSINIICMSFEFDLLILLYWAQNFYYGFGYSLMKTELYTNNIFEWGNTVRLG